MGTFKAPLGRGKSKLKGDGEDCSGINALVSILRWLRGILVQGVDEGEMAGKYPLSREGNREGCLSSQLGGYKGAGSSGVADADATTNGQVEEDPGERWFR